MKAKAYLNFQSQRGFSIVCNYCAKKKKSNTVDQRHIEYGKTIVDPPNLGMSQPCNICGCYAELENPIGKKITIVLGEHW